LRRTARSLAGHAGVAGFQEVSEMASGLDALLGELIEKPQHLGASPSRTLVDAVDSLDLLFARAADSAQGSSVSLVLVVDADPGSRASVAQALGRLNVATVVASGVEAAQRLIAENTFCLIFVDAALPESSGFDLCRQVRSLPLNQATPVVFVTDTADSESRDLCIASGGNDVIAKPFLPMELAVKASSLLRRPRTPRVGAAAESGAAVRP